MQCQKMSRLNRRRMHTLLLCQPTLQWKDVCLLAAEITAWFQNIDDAEAAARELRRRGRGIRSLRIRQPRPRTGEGGSAAFQALALYASPSAQAAVGGSMPFATPGYFPGLWEDAAAAEAGDGPAKRKDSLMIIRTEDGSARQVAAILTALHASHVRITPGLPRS